MDSRRSIHSPLDQKKLARSSLMIDECPGSPPPGRHCNVQGLASSRPASTSSSERERGGARGPRSRPLARAHGIDAWPGRTLGRLFSAEGGQIY